MVQAPPTGTHPLSGAPTPPTHPPNACSCPQRQAEDHARADGAPARAADQGAAADARLKEEARLVFAARPPSHHPRRRGRARAARPWLDRPHSDCAFGNPGLYLFGSLKRPRPAYCLCGVRLRRRVTTSRVTASLMGRRCVTASWQLAPMSRVTFFSTVVLCERMKSRMPPWERDRPDAGGVKSGPGAVLPWPCPPN